MLAVRSTCALALALLLTSAPLRAAEPNAEARRLYAEGKAEYAQGHYAEAVALFEQSYALSESPALLFNMAQAHRLAGPLHCRSALSLYKSYLASQPDAENRLEVEERIVELGDCSSQHAPEPARAAAPQPEPRRAPATQVPRKGLPTGPVLLAGGGAALLVAGGVLYARAWDKHREARRRCPCYPGTYANWEVLTNVSYALLAVGGATLAGGVTWWVVGEPAKHGQPASAMLGVAGEF